MVCCCSSQRPWALIWANSQWSAGYQDFWHTQITLWVGSWNIEMTLSHFVNDGLMALFFFVVGLEIKRELVTGELADRRAAALPAIAALGGMVVPAGLFPVLHDRACRSWWLGDSDGDRHRLRCWRGSASRQQGVTATEAVPVDASDRR